MCSFKKELFFTSENNLLGFNLRGNFVEYDSMTFHANLKTKVFENDRVMK